MFFEARQLLVPDLSSPDFGAFTLWIDTVWVNRPKIPIDCKSLSSNKIVYILFLNRFKPPKIWSGGKNPPSPKSWNVLTSSLWFLLKTSKIARKAKVFLRIFKKTSKNELDPFSNSHKNASVSIWKFVSQEKMIKHFYFQLFGNFSGQKLGFHIFWIFSETIKIYELDPLPNL